jgi:glycosyltransferase involved in cell wall biosynthesis
MRILYIQSTTVPPPTDVQTDRFYLLSDTMGGDVLQPAWFRSPGEVEAIFGVGSYPIYTVGNFRYHWMLAGRWRYQGIWQRLAKFAFYVRKGLELHRKQPYDCIIAYSHMTTGLCAGILKLLVGCKLIIEIVTAPKLIYLTMRPRPTWGERLMHLYSDACLHLSMLLSDRLHLLYPRQLSEYSLSYKVRKSVFHEFVPVSAVYRRSTYEDPEPFVLLVGAPWYLKGADRLIEAFHGLANDFPNVKLKILGYYPDRSGLEALTVGLQQIEILEPRSNPEVLRMISQATVMVLPSRCEGVARVLIEGMAAGIPLIGSEAGGVPFVVRDQENGFIVSGGESKSLEKRLRELLVDPELRRRMGENGYLRAHTELNERIYVEQFTRMVEATVRGE